MSKLKVSQDLLDLLHPVGEYYETSNASFNPNDEWGGTWVEDTNGKVTVAKDTGTFKTLRSVVGSETHTLSVEEMPRHNHQYEDITGHRSLNGQFGRDGIYSNENYMGVSNSVTAYSEADFRMTYVGGSKPHNNIQPSIVVIRWHRIA